MTQSNPTVDDVKPKPGDFPNKNNKTNETKEAANVINDVLVRTGYKVRQTGLNRSPGGRFRHAHPRTARQFTAPSRAGSEHHIPPGEPCPHPAPEVPLCLVVPGVRELVLAS